MCNQWRCKRIQEKKRKIFKLYEFYSNRTDNFFDTEYPSENSTKEIGMNEIGDKSVWLKILGNPSESSDDFKIENIFAPQKRSAGVDTERIERRNLVAQSGRAKGFLQGA